MPYEAPRKKRVFGQNLLGITYMADDWDSTLPPEIQRYFDGESDPEDLLDDGYRLRVIVDTHIFIWCDRQPRAVPPALLAILRDVSNDVFVERCLGVGNRHQACDRQATIPDAHS